MPSKNGGLLDVGGLVVPGVELAGRDLERRQSASPSKTLAYSLWNCSGWTRRAMASATSAAVGQMSLEVDGLAVPVGAERLLGEVDVQRAGEGVGDDQGRRGQVVHAHLGLMRPSKLRLPERTAATTRSSSRDGLGTASGSGPELPMQVVQP